MDTKARTRIAHARARYHAALAEHQAFYSLVDDGISSMTLFSYKAELKIPVSPKTMRRILDALMSAADKRLFEAETSLKEVIEDERKYALQVDKKKQAAKQQN